MHFFLCSVSLSPPDDLEPVWGVDRSSSDILMFSLQALATVNLFGVYIYA